MKRTLFPLLHLECEVQSSYGEVDGLGVRLTHGTEEIENVTPLLSHKARQELRYPWQPVVRRDAIVILIHSLRTERRGRGKEGRGEEKRREE